MIEYNIDEKKIQDMIYKTNDEVPKKIDWTNVWSKKYPVLVTYQNEVKVSGYAKALNNLLDNLQKEYGYNELDAMLVLKDILAVVWKSRKK